MAKEDKKQVTREVGEQVKFRGSIDASTVKDLGDGVFETIITTSSVDRHAESITTEGVDTDTWLKNPVVLYGHDYSALPIGKGLSLRTFKNKITARFQLAVKEYEFARTVADLIKGGYLNAVSIGGVVREWSDDYKTIEKMDMVEFSVVPVPANPEALITGKAFMEATHGKSMDDVKQEYEDFVKDNLVDKFKSLEEDDISQAVKVLKNLTAALEASVKATASNGDEDTEDVKRIKRIRVADNLKAIDRETERAIKLIKLKK